MLAVKRTLALAFMLACESATSPTLGGAYCTSEQRDTVQRFQQNPAVNVTVYLNWTSTRQIAGADGVVRSQEFRECRSYACNHTSTTKTDAQLIQECRDAATARFT